MKVFIGSSTEKIDFMHKVADWLQAEGYEPLCWDSPEVFPPGQLVLLKLLELTRTVDGAVFLFSEDDKSWYRGDAVPIPRDNVLLEYGMFTSVLGLSKSVIVRWGDTKVGSDLAGLTYVPFTPDREYDARQRFKAWLRRLTGGYEDPAITEKEMTIYAQRREIDRLVADNEFQRSTLRELRNKVEASDLQPKIVLELYEKDYFMGAATQLAKQNPTPRLLREYLRKLDLLDLEGLIAWDNLDEPTRAFWFARKVLNAVRLFDRTEDWSKIAKSRAPQPSAP